MMSGGTQKENQAPISLPTTLNGMLKTTTETGDIGQFAIKPSRLPPPRKSIDPRNDYLSQGPQQTFQLQNGEQVVDDRRRLPSYARDTTSEIVSLYETASQKAASRPRVFETPDHRSCSMTQTSYSSNALSNHRSYTSLRSQPELSLLPRPRSPFIYPARLKRLGFPPSSPIPLETGRADSSRNTELERMPYTTGTIPLSASPLSTYNRRPPFPSTIQPDSIITYPSTLGCLPSGSRSYSPSLKSTIDPMRDWSFSPKLASTKASPAGNNSRSISTPVNYHRRSPNSFTASTSKSHTPSPLYYDYTEDFNITEATTRGGATENASSSIPFILGKGTQESRVPAAEVSRQYDSGLQGSSTGVGFCVLTTLSNTNSLKSLDDKPRLNSEDGQTERSTNTTQDIISLYLDRRPYDRIVTDQIDNKDYLRSNNFQSTVDGDLPSTQDTGNSFNRTHFDVVDGTNHNLNIAQSLEDKESLGQRHWNNGTPASDRTSCFRMSTYLPIFPKPPDRTVQMITDGGLKTCQETPARLSLDTIPIQRTRKFSTQIASEGFGHGDHYHMTKTPRRHQDLPTGSIQRSATTHERRIRSSRYYSIDHGLSDLAQLISNFEVANGSLMSQDAYSPSAEVSTPLSMQPLSNCRLPMGSLISPNKAQLQLDPCLESCTPLNRFRSDSDLRASSSRTFQTRSGALHEKVTLLDNYGKDGEEALSFPDSANGLVTERPQSLSEPPLLAPNAISPAQVLRLKNGVPQLMKALPPVPQICTLEGLLSRESSPHHVTSITGPIDLMDKDASVDKTAIQLEGSFSHSMPSQQGLEDVIDQEQKFSPHPKFRIKSRLFDAQRCNSPANSRPWNQDENYPWYSQQPTIRLSSLRSIIPGSQRGPKFKLRVTRASTSPSGTIRINPEARNSLNLRSPKDLFTSSSNLSGIFRQVSRQFSSRKSSAVIGAAPGNDIRASSAVFASTQGNGSHEHSLDLLRPPLSPTMAHPTSPTEVRSFFSEDSSQLRGHNSLRERISNLRARIPNPYTSRPAAHLNDNEAWKRNFTPCAPMEGRSRALIHSEQEDEYGMPIASLQHRRLRSKVSRWFKDAGMAVRRGVKLHNRADVHCIPYR